LYKLSYTNVSLLQNTRIYSLDYITKSEQKLESTPVVHAMVLKQNTYYWNMNITISIVTQISNNLKKIDMYSYSIHFSLFVFIGNLSHSITKTVSSSISNFHSRFHKSNHIYYRLTHYRYQFHRYHHHLIGIDAQQSPYPKP
jgi:hypothetical protein